MARNYKSGTPLLSHSRQQAHTIIAVGFVLLLAVSSGLAFGMYDSKREKAAAVPIKAATDAAAVGPAALADETAGAATQEKAETMQQPASATNQSSSTTTVTVNGRTTTVSGNGSVKKSYTSEDGSSKVNISVQNTTNKLKEELKKP
jgi:hypothetical protein